MSDTTASLRRKIASAGDLQSVVRSMKALAASSIGQYESSERALADYYRTVELGLGICFRKSATLRSLINEYRFVSLFRACAESAPRTIESPNDRARFERRLARVRDALDTEPVLAQSTKA